MSGRPASAKELLLAKVYKLPDQRSFHSDAAYREGMYIGDARLRRASRKHTKAGRQADFAMWLSNEYDTLRILHGAGADVPEPFAFNGRAILMEYFGDEDGPAPQLARVDLDVDEAQALLKQLLDNIRLWLCNHRVHADLSAFNILYWQGSLKVIDFPQAVDPRLNSQARTFLQRDLDNVCRHFRKYGVNSESGRIAADLWERYLCGRL